MAENGGGLEVNGAWAVCIAHEKAGAAAALRLQPGIVVLDTGDALWLRGDDLTPDIALHLRKLPDATHFEVNASTKVLTPVGSRIPSGQLPEGQWVTINSHFRPSPQPAALCGVFDDAAPLRVVAGGGNQAPAVLLTRWEIWHDYVLHAPQIRLRVLRFALSGDGRVVVTGTPLPPLPGVRCFEREGVALPCGFGFAPAIDFSEVRAMVGAISGEFVLCNSDASYESLPADCFVPATRANVRATAEALSSASGAA